VVVAVVVQERSAFSGWQLAKRLKRYLRATEVQSNRELVVVVRFVAAATVEQQFSAV
jgi:hypothetical protein